MYIRWQTRKRRRPAFGRRAGGGDIHHAAILAENVRVKGKPTQRHVTYLGGITDSAIQIVHKRYYFWQKVTLQLGNLKLPRNERRNIESAIALRVPRPTKAECRRVERDRKALGADKGGMTPRRT
jgi:hypothetical protein